jgi:type I restriction enzyme M protein
VVDLAQVQANEYNLNIPRYVDTFEAEAVLDLAAIAAEIRRIEAAEVGTRASIAAFCAELGIDAPFVVEGK